MNISNLQKRIISETEKIIRKNYFFSHSLSYFPIFGNAPGTIFLKSKIESKYKFNHLITSVKFFLSIFFSRVKFKKYFEANHSFKNIYFSWGFHKNFDKNGNFKDRYTNKNVSKFKDTLIFLIYLDAQLPKKVKSNTVLVYKKLPIDDPKQRKPDITKARTMLNWEPKVNLEEGLTKTIDWVSSQL